MSGPLRLAALPLLALAAAPVGLLGGLPPPTSAASGPDLVLPVGPPLVVLRPFQPPPTDAPWLPGHRGVDLAADPGSPVRSAADGTVTFAGPLAGRGVVVVASGPLRRTYEPVRASVHSRDHVAAGTTIGHLQAAPGHCGVRSCLHWGLLRGKVYLDPLAPLGPLAARVRLLPLSHDPVLAPAGSSVTNGHAMAGEPTAAAVAGVGGGGPPGGRSTGVVAGLAAAAGGGLAVAGAAVGGSRVLRRRAGARPRGP